MINEIIKIINIEKDKRTYLVTTNEDTYRFDEDTIVKHFIVKDKEFTKKEFKKILQDLEQNALFNKTLKYLTYGERTTYEIKEYLKDDSRADKIINRLKALGYLDDEKYALKYLDYCYNNCKGPIYLQAKLKEKGVANSIIENTLTKYAVDMEVEVINSFLAKELKNIKHLPVIAQKRQLLDHLIRRGFSSEVINPQLNSLEIIDESDETLRREFEKQKIKMQAKNLSEYEMKQKIIAYLFSKGYEYQKIIEIIE